MTTVGIRELKSRLSRYRKRARGGECLLVTDRGEPVAVISLPETTTADQRIEAMLRAGVATWAGGKPRGATRPPRVKRKPVAATVVDGRR